MSTFTTPLKVELIGPNRFKLIEPFEYHIGEYPAESPLRIIKVPIGFVTDFASIPRPFWSILYPIDEYAKAAVVHDYLHFTGHFDRQITDLIFRECMRILRVPKWKRKIVYNAVKYFSGFAWKKNRKRFGINTDEIIELDPEIFSND